MRLRAFLLPCLLSFFVALAAAFWVRSPGYMDADYYYATAIGLARGEGFRESFLWNYLDDPSGLPHPSHLYWMPLTTMTAALPMALAEGGFRTAQLPFLLLTALLPAVSGLLAFSLSNRRDLALQAAYLSALPGFFLPFFVTTDAFSLCAILGGLLLLTLQRSHQAGLPRWLLVGALVGAAHLARADGLRCPLCGADVPRAWALDSDGRPTAAPGPIKCPQCDFRLDACRHCAHFLPGKPQGWGGRSWSSDDLTFGRCSVYKELQPVEQVSSPEMAGQLKARGFDQVRAPLPIVDSYMPPDFCAAFKLDRRRLQASGIRWPDARRVALLRMLGVLPASQTESHDHAQP